MFSWLNRDTNRLLRHAEHGQVEEDADDRHHQSADSACCQWKPERSFLANQERHETEDGGYYRQEDRNDLHVPRFGVGTQWS